MLILLLQLCSVELQMCLHDQPGGEVSDDCVGVLPACCSLLERALFSLHSDVDDENSDGGDDDDDDDDDATREGDPWLAALSDEQSSRRSSPPAHRYGRA